MGPYLHRGDGNLRSESIPAGGSRPKTALSVSYPANRAPHHIYKITSRQFHLPQIPSLTRIIYVPHEGLSLLRRMLIYLIVVGAGFPFAASSSARERRHIDATPSSHAPSNVLSGEPSTPFCG